ncbi:MAG: glycoside hydrolase family 2 TIM barrel-domain containing protein [Planctomycetota bacterium]
MSQTVIVIAALAALAGTSAASAETVDVPENTTGYREGPANIGERAGLADREARSPELQADIEASVLPPVRLTPPITGIAGLEAFSMSLNGTWNFRNRLPEGFNGTIAGVETWDEMTVPGSPAANGFEPMEREFGKPVGWARTFDVPAEWGGSRIVLHFGTLDGLAKVYLNGELVGTSEHAFLPAEFDITDAITDGTQELVVTMERSYPTHWHNREFGGMGRDVTLMALPPVNLARFHVQTIFDEAFENATVEVLAAVANQSDAPMSGGALTFAIDGLADQTVELPEIPAGKTHHLTMKVPVESPKHWHPETPNLYDATLTFSRDGETVMASERRMGFVQVENRDGVLTVNGAPFKVKANNYHTTYLGHDHSPPDQVLRDDVDLFVDTNHNSMRPWPTPNMAYMEAADEFGMFTTIEVPTLAMIYSDGPWKDKGDNRLMMEPYQKVAAVTLETYRSHPSVLTWGLGNESPYYEYFERAAFGIAKEDPTRMVFFGSDFRIGIDKPGLTFNDDHYPRWGRVTEDDTAIVGGDWERFPTDKPIMFTEWAHVHWNNWSEKAFDPGVFEYWGHYVKAHVNETYNHPHVAGGMIFGSTPLRGIWRDFDFGHWDLWRQPNDTAWIVKKGYSPVPLLDVVHRPVDLNKPKIRPEAIQFIVENRHSILDLADLTIDYKQGKFSGEVEASLRPGEIGPIEVPFNPDVEEPLRITLTDPRGRVIDEHEFVLDRPEPLPTIVDAAALEIVTEGNVTTLANDRVSFSIDMETGKLTNASVDGTQVIASGPYPVLRKSGDAGWPKNSEPVTNVLDEWEADSVELIEGTEPIVRVTGSYNYADVEYRMHFGGDGTLTVEWQATWTEDRIVDLFQTGVLFETTEGFETVSWRRDRDRALWTAYPETHIGRPVGTATRYGDTSTLDARRAWKKDDRSDWPWSQDLINTDNPAITSTNDFRATKFGILAGSLTNAEGVALSVDSNGDQNFQVFPLESGGTAFQVGSFHNGGTEHHLVKSVRKDVLQTKLGLVITDSVELRLRPKPE